VNLHFTSAEGEGEEVTAKGRPWVIFSNRFPNQMLSLLLVFLFMTRLFIQQSLETTLYL
jgi:hypothetical protein